MVDILSHSLVPKHEILSTKDRKEVLSNFGIKKEQLPKILESDAITKNIKAKKGDVIRIIRKSPTANEATYYRIVV